MYIPTINHLTDLSEILEFIQRFSFGTIITSVEGKPIATPLPFLASIQDNQIVLQAHFAKANEHWKYIVDQESLIIFQEPHAYISPSHYEKEQNVPTWNYISVHLYGKAIWAPSEEVSQRILEASIDFYESTYQKQWYGLSEDYKSRMLKGIVAFEFFVSEIQAKKKISQNRTEKEQVQIAEALSKSSSTQDQLIGEYMSKNFKKSK